MGKNELSSYHLLKEEDKALFDTTNTCHKEYKPHITLGFSKLPPLIPNCASPFHSIPVLPNHPLTRLTNSLFLNLGSQAYVLPGANS